MHRLSIIISIKQHSLVHSSCIIMYWSSYLAALLALSTYGLSSPLPLETGNAGVRQDIIHRTLTKRLLDIDKRAECSAEELQDQASEEDDDDEAAPTGDQAAGFGAEFESSAIRIMADSDCGLDDKNKVCPSVTLGGISPPIDLSLTGRT